VIFANAPGINWGDALNNWAFAFLGNVVGASVFVAGAYWYLYVRPDMDQTESAAPASPASSLREVMSSLP
jgi:formate/nitrite transporter FocA (FNT family)